MGLKNFPLLQNLTQFVLGKDQAEDKPAIDIWTYAEPAGEEPSIDYLCAGAGGCFSGPAC